MTSDLAIENTIVMYDHHHEESVSLMEERIGIQSTFLISFHSIVCPHACRPTNEKTKKTVIVLAIISLLKCLMVLSTHNYANLR